MKSLSILFLLCAISVQAQTDSLSDRQSRKTHHKSSNIIKVDPIKVVGGELPFSFEHRFGKRFSLELASGPTLSNFLKDRYWIEDVRNIHFYEEYYYGQKKRIGATYGLMARYYLQKKAVPMTGFYVAGGIRHRVFRDFGGCYTSELIPQVQVGYQLATPGAFLLDFYIGLGQDNLSFEGQYDYYYGGAVGNDFAKIEGTSSYPLPMAGVRTSFHRHPGVGKKVRPPKPARNPKDESDDVTKRFAVKLDPLQVMRGDFPLSVEVKIARRWSVQLTGGYTRSRVAFERGYLEPEYPHNHWTRSYEDGLSGNGYSVGAAARWYPLRTAMNGLYLSPVFRFRRYNDNYEYSSVNPGTGETYRREAKGYTNETSAGFVIGYQAWAGKHVCVDIYGGPLYTGLTTYYQYMGEKAPGDMSFFEPEYYGKTDTQQRVLFALGVRLGYAF